MSLQAQPSSQPQSPNLPTKHRARERSRSVGLFLWLSAIFVAYPIIPSQSVAKIVLDLLFSGAILLGLLAQAELTRPWRLTYIVLGLASVASTWLPAAIVDVGFATPLLYALFFGVSILIHFRIVMHESEVGWESLFGAACTYLLLGLFFASVYGLLIEMDPAAFTVPSNREQNHLGPMVYFSFITLTTLGYGDVLPNSHAAQMLAAYEAVIGQLFIAGIVGVLVGTYVSNSQKQKHRE